MNKKIIILASFSISALAFSQDISTIRNISNVYDNNPTTGTARYSAMAGSMGALGGDLSSINSNPAGIGVFITGDINGSLHISSQNTTASLAGKSYKNNSDHTFLGQVGGVTSFQTNADSQWKFFNIGMNHSKERLTNRIQTPENHNIKFPFTPTTGNPDNNLYAGHQYETLGNRSKFNLSFGGNYDHKIYVGASVNMSSVNIEQHDETLIASENNPNRSWYFKKQNTPFTESANGFSLSLGVIGKINNQLRLGASFESPTWYSIEREYIYYSPDYSSNIYAENRSMRTPSKLTLSGAFIPNKNFAFNVDYRLDVGKPRFSGTDAAEAQLNDFLQSTYKAQNEVRLGAEYRLKQFRIRGGYAFANSPYKNYTVASSFNTDGSTATNTAVSNYIVGNSQVISGGLGYDFKSFYIDATYQHLSKTYTNPAFDGLFVLSGTDGYHLDNNGTSVLSNVKSNKGNFILTLGWKF